MRIIIIGSNKQAAMRQAIIGDAYVATTATIQKIPTTDYDAVFICSAHELKYNIARYALVNKKHVLVEAPLWGANVAQLEELEHLALVNNVVFYIAYSYRFSNELARVHELIHNDALGDIRHCRLLYSAVMDEHCNDALIDLCPHLLDLLYFWFDENIMQHNFRIIYKERYSSQVIFADFDSKFTIEVEANLMVASNKITCEIYSSINSVHINLLNDVAFKTELMQKEYVYFKQLCENTRNLTFSMVNKWIYTELDDLSKEELLLA